MDNQPLKLYAMLLGCRPPGRNIEQHDVFFTIASSLPGTIDNIKKFWPEVKANIHIDAWREVNCVDGYSISIVSKQESNSSHALFFINLGGYKAGEWEEFHYKMMVVAESKEAAITKAKQTTFYKHTGIPGAVAHVDDKYGIDADDVHEINEILPRDIIEKYTIEISDDQNLKPDEMHLGFLPLYKIK